jgi:hypothetical protein
MPQDKQRLSMGAEYRFWVENDDHRMVGINHFFGIKISISKIICSYWSVVYL